MMVSGGTRTYHRLASGVEDAGFTIKDCLLWCYNSGFPKAQDLGKILDKRAGKEGKVVGKKKLWGHNAGSGAGSFSKNKYEGQTGIVRNEDIREPATEDAKRWDGWKVGGLKPSYEPIVWVVKPPKGSWTENVLKYGNM